MGGGYCCTGFMEEPPPERGDRNCKRDAVKNEMPSFSPRFMRTTRARSGESVESLCVCTCRSFSRFSHPLSVFLPMRFRFFQVNFFTDFFHICGLSCEDGQLPSFVAHFSMKDDGRIICGFSSYSNNIPIYFVVAHDEYVKPMP